jgi:hypothetical protein
MPKTITKENAMQFVEMRRAMGKMGGRPKGVLSKTTIAKIKGKETFLVRHQLLKSIQHFIMIAAKIVCLIALFCFAGISYLKNCNKQ